MDTETQPLWTTTREALGKSYTIGLWPDDATLGREGSVYGGRMDHRKQQIPINATIPCDGRDEVVLHEIIHRVSAEFDLGLKESQVNALSSGIYGFLRGFGLWQEFLWPDRQESKEEK